MINEINKTYSLYIMKLLVFEIMSSNCMWIFFSDLGLSTLIHNLQWKVSFSSAKKKKKFRYLYWKSSVTWVKCPTFLSSFGPPIVKSLTSSYQSLTTPAQLRSYPAEAKFCPTENRPVNIECMLFKFIQSFSYVLNVFTIILYVMKKNWLYEIISLWFRTISSFIYKLPLSNDYYVILYLRMY